MLGDDAIKMYIQLYVSMYVCTHMYSRWPKRLYVLERSACMYRLPTSTPNLPTYLPTYLGRSTTTDKNNATWKTSFLIKVLGGPSIIIILDLDPASLLLLLL